MASSLTSRSSASSSSSLASTFSDISSATSDHNSNSNSKTNAFFASPFSTAPPSPSPSTPPPPPPPLPPKPRSLTEEFFSAPARPPSPPASAAPRIVTKQSAIHPSRIFPSRYTSQIRRSPDSHFVSLDNHAFNTSYGHDRDSSNYSNYSDSSSNSSFAEPRLPTPPPSASTSRRSLHRDDTVMPIDFAAPSVPPKEEPYDTADEATPRPADLEPNLLHFERSLLLSRQNAIQETSTPESTRVDDDAGDGEDELRPGTIIELPATQLPLSPLSLNFSIASPDIIDRGTPTPTNESSTFVPSFPSTPAAQPTLSSSPSPSPSPESLASPPLPPADHTGTDTETPRLRLLKSLGHGAFSAVWLAEDLSPVPLTLVSKKSVRDLRRRVSGRDRERERREVKRERRVEVKLPELPPPPHKTETEQMAMAVDPTPPTPARRPPNRLREGLRNMLSFSRSSTIPAMPSPISPSFSPSFSLSPSLSSSVSSSGGTTTVEVTEDGALSRHSSIKSLPSVASDYAASSSSLSRNSSVRSSRGPSRNSSLRLALAQRRGGEAGGSNPSVDANANANWMMEEEEEEATATAATAAVSAVKAAQGTTLSRDSSLKKFRERVRGTKPASGLGRSYLDERDGEMGEPAEFTVLPAPAPASVSASVSGSGSAFASASASAAEDRAVVLSGSLSRNSSLGSASASGSVRSGSMRSGGAGAGAGAGRLVAVKMTPRRPRGVHARGKEREEEERTRVGFVREVEVLRHISHPNITPLLAHLSTSTHHILVLPYLPGGDLLGLVNNDVAWGKLGESVLRRIWCELCKAVGWMHGVGLVHRDIKLENILLTTPTFTTLTPLSPRPTLSSLPTPPLPLIKLTDFGLSRFVELRAGGDAERLTTRCGSEAYAAPELVTGGGAGGGGGYDARRTDAWACGVVLYALVGRRLPFGEGVGAEGVGMQRRIGGERGPRSLEKGYYSAAERRHWLMRIARGEWEWPGEESSSSGNSPESTPGFEGGEQHPHHHEHPHQHQQQEEREQQREGEEGKGEGEEDELVGPQLVKSQGARRIVGRLLVRDPGKRARIVDLWDDVWMQGGVSGEQQGQGGEGGGRGLGGGVGSGSGRGDEDLKSLSSALRPDAHEVDSKAPSLNLPPSPTKFEEEEAKEERNPHMLQDIDDDDEEGGEDESMSVGYDRPLPSEDSGDRYLFTNRGRGDEESDAGRLFGDETRARAGLGGAGEEEGQGEGELLGEGGELELEQGLDAEEELEELEELEEEDGCLFDHEGIDSITRREVV